MKRDEWTFTYTASKLAEAAAKKLEAHRIKLKWWEGKKSEVMDRVAKDGIEVHDSVAAGYSSNKGMFGPQIVIDAALQRDLTECQEKIGEHTRMVSSYDGWLQVLSGNPESRLDLNHDDYLFFFAEDKHTKKGDGE